MVIKLKTVQKKDLNSNKLNNKRKKLKNKKLHLKDFANSVKKFLVIKLKRYKLDKDLQNHLVPWSLVNTDGQLIWKEL